MSSRQLDAWKKTPLVVNDLENYMLHVLDLRANYWSLWTEARNLARYNEMYPRGFELLRTNLGYRLRPAWVWQRKRHGTFELIVAVSNRGVASVPGVLWLQLESPDGRLKLRGSLDAGQPHGGGTRQASLVTAEPVHWPGQSLCAARNSSGNMDAGELGV